MINMNAEIISKLKILSFNDKLVLNCPKDIDIFNGIDFDMSVDKPKYDIVLVFIFSLDEFSEIVKMAIEKELINPNGYLYFVYLKKGNKQYNEYIGRDDFFDSVHIDKDGFVLNSKLKFNKMVAFNDTFTCIGLKHETKMKVYTTNYKNVFIEVAEDCLATKGDIPPMKNNEKTVANIQFEMLVGNPYKYTSDDVLFYVFANKNNIPEAEWKKSREQFFSKGQPCFRASPLTKKYGFGVHHDNNGKIAIYGVETPEYEKYVADEIVKKVKAMRNKRQ